MSLEGRIGVGAVLIVAFCWIFCWFTDNEQVFYDEVDVMMNSSWEGVKMGARAVGIPIDDFHWPSAKDHLKWLTFSSPTGSALLAETAKSESQKFQEIIEALDKSFTTILDLKKQSGIPIEKPINDKPVKLGGYWFGLWDYVTILESRLITPIFRKAINLQIEENLTWKKKEREDYKALIIDYFNRQTDAVLDQVGVYYKMGLEAVGKLNAMKEALEALKNRDKKADILLTQLENKSKELKQTLVGTTKMILQIVQEATDDCPCAKAPTPNRLEKVFVESNNDFRYWQHAIEEVTKFEFK